MRFFSLPNSLPKTIRGHAFALRRPVWRFGRVLESRVGLSARQRAAERTVEAQALDRLTDGAERAAEARAFSFFD